MFKFIEDNKKKFREKCNKSILDLYDSCKKENKLITEKQIEELCITHGCNNYDLKLLHDICDDAFLIKIIDKYMKYEPAFNEISEYGVPESYKDAVCRQLLPLLVRRLKSQRGLA